jgi:hypothetical protein
MTISEIDADLSKFWDEHRLEPRFIVISGDGSLRRKLRKWIGLCGCRIHSGIVKAWARKWARQNRAGLVG